MTGHGWYGTFAQGGQAGVGTNLLLDFATVSDQPMAFQQGPDYIARDAKQLGGAHLIGIAVMKRVPDELPLHLSKQVAHRRTKGVAHCITDPVHDL